ncbi:bifunctional metallophosphatase/5'-nucleotidase [Companilactobacillus tucceti]|nr:bifunctional metallophosphatase/5'-nucleotidase [Companilactobacillus tucceti]
METIKIIHTNDLHSHFENFPRIKRFIEDKRTNNSDDEFYLFDIGDAMDRAHPLTDATDGKSNIEWLNSLKYDAATIGNNEGLGNSHSELNHLYGKANFEVILGNLFDKETGKLASFAKPYKIIETKKNTKIGVLGLTAPYILTYPLLDWDIHLIQETLPGLVSKLEKDCDVIILLSHLGVSMDRRIAKKYPQIDVVIGSHTHHLFEKGEMDNGVLLAAAGKYGQNIGEINLVLDDDKKITRKDAVTTRTSSLQENPEDKAWIDGKMHQGEQLLDEVKVANIPQTMSRNINKENPVIEEGLTAIKEFADADAAILSSGLFLQSLHKGTVSKNDLHKMLPHAIHVMRTKMSGDNVWRLVMEMEKNRAFLRNHPQKGMGFRGKTFGEIVYRGISIDDKKNVYINGEAIHKKKEYTLALLDHYLFVPYFPSIEISGNNDILYPKFLRSVFGDYLSKKYPI